MGLLFAQSVDWLLVARILKISLLKLTCLGKDSYTFAATILRDDVQNEQVKDIQKPCRALNYGVHPGLWVMSCLHLVGQ